MSALTIEGSTLIKALREQLSGVLREPILDHLTSAVKNGKITIAVPDEIRLVFNRRHRGRPKPYSYSYLWCPSCGDIKHRKIRRRRAGAQTCPSCGRKMIPPPLFVPLFPVYRAPSFYLNPEGSGSDRDLGYIVSAPRVPGATCPITGAQKKIVRLNPKRPMESLVFGCPYENGRPQTLGGEVCPYYRTYSNKTVCLAARSGQQTITGEFKHERLPPEKASLLRERTRLKSYFPAVARAPVKVTYKPQPLVGGYVPKMMPVVPSEGLVRPIVVSFHSYSQEDAVPIEYDRSALPGISSMIFVKKLRVHQLAVASLFGVPEAPRATKGVFIDKSPSGNVVFYANILETQGIVVELNRRLSKGEEQDLKLVHSASHSFLKNVSIAAGLDPSEFMESLDVANMQFAVYDNSQGGVGGVKSILEEHRNAEDGESYRLSPDFAENLVKSSDCFYECNSACKACLFVYPCPLLNSSLDRHLLTDVINRDFGGVQTDGS